MTAEEFENNSILNLQEDNGPDVDVDEDDSDEIVLHIDPILRDMEAPDYLLSNCDGKKKALIIGINYFGTEHELKGCINDALNIKQFLIDLYGFEEDNMRILTDDQDDPNLQPTRANIISGMMWLVEDAQPHDSFFLHFSGHGGSVKDLSNDEYDGYDETIYPVDFERYEGESGQLVDDDMHDILVSPLPKGCRLTAIFDSCHSGTALDLPYIYSTKGELKNVNLFKYATREIIKAGMILFDGDMEKAREQIKELPVNLLEVRNVEAANRQRLSSPADVIMFSGCKDHQFSADSQEQGEATGAMSHAFIQTLRENPDQTYKELLNSLRKILRFKYSQRPQLSSSHPIDVDQRFIC